MRAVQSRITQATAAPCTPHHAAKSVQHRAVAAPSRRLVLSGLSLGLMVVSLPARAVGIESVELPPLPTLEQPQFLQELGAKNQATLEAAEESFESSELLKTLRERSDANRAARKKELADRYCKRQAELGVGDCGGLRLIPGMTKSGVQKRPEWLEKLFGSE